MKGFEFGFNLDKNVSTRERIVSVISGSFLLINGVTGKKSIKLILSGGMLLFRGITGHCHIYNLVVKKKELTDDGKILVKTTVIVDKPRSEVYAFWRKLENLPLFMTHIKSVNVIDRKQSEWSIKIMNGINTIEWTAEIVQDKKNVILAWESLPGSEIENSGEVEFEDTEDGKTKVTARIGYKAPGGKIGDIAAFLLNPFLRMKIRQDIMNLKNYLEAGKISKTKLSANGFNHLTISPN